MAFISTGLSNGGNTPHYSITYQDSLSPAEGVNVTNGLLASCEQDFALLKGWFGGRELSLPYPIPVNVTNATGGALTAIPSGFELFFGLNVTDIVLKPGPGASVNLLRYLVVSEVAELFMLAMGDGWFEGHGFFNGGDEGSKGEGLSRFLGIQFQLANGLTDVPPPGYAITQTWLNSPGRQNFVDVAPDDHSFDPTNGCTTLFLYYLRSQLGFSVNAIIGASSSTLAGVYSNLTGRSDGWTSFIHLLNAHYPPAFKYNPPADDLFAVADLAAFWGPGAITCGYSGSARLFIDRPAMAEVNVTLTSSDPSLVTVPSTATIQPGSISVVINVQTAAIPIPFPPKLVTVHAAYAGQTRSIAIEVVPPAVVSVTLSPDTVVCGHPSTATVTVDNPSLMGDIVVELICGAPGFAIVPAQFTIPHNQPSAQFTIQTPDSLIPFVPRHVVIFATYSGSSASATLTINPRVIAGIISDLTLFPPTVTGGQSSTGMVTLSAPVPVPTRVGLAAQELGPGAGGGGGSLIASVPPSITIPAGHVTWVFPISTTQILAPENTRLATIVAAAVNVKFATLRVTR
jgi:hypothetical protein